MTPRTMWAIACDSLRDRVLAADFEAQGQIAVEGAEKLLAFARRLAGMESYGPTAGEQDVDLDVLCGAIEETAQALSESRRSLAATHTEMKSLGPRIDALEQTLAEALTRAENAEVERDQAHAKIAGLQNEAASLEAKLEIMAQDLAEARRGMALANNVERLCTALGRARGMLYSVKFGDWRMSELDEVIDATSYTALVEESKE